MQNSHLLAKKKMDFSGAGINLKPQHYDEAIALALPDTADKSLWFEVHTENYFVAGGPRLAYLQKIRELYPLSLHGVGASLGNPSLLTEPHLKQVAELVERFDPFLVSEHATWSSSQNAYFADLLPLPRTQSALTTLCDGIEKYQTAIGRSILIENPTNYLDFVADMDEADFLMEAVKRTGSGLLLDVNNLYLSSKNTGMDVNAYLDGLEGDLIGEIHIAGFAIDENFPERLLIDSHGAPVADGVWQLLERVLSRFGPKPVLLERDDNIPTFNELMLERNQAQSYLDSMTPLSKLAANSAPNGVHLE
jgi:uncharacterized protein (UPF0276 family)